MPFGSPRTPRPFATHVRATVKWYNPSKGFGFVTPDDGSADVFLHVSVVEQAGLQSLNEGAILVCDLADGQKGPQVSTIHSVEAGTAAGQRGNRSATGSRYPRQSVSDYDDYGYGSKSSSGGTVEGTVKWFNPDKGFGFIVPDQGGKDIFVHIRAVERAGLSTLRDNQRVRFIEKAGQKGTEADGIEVI
ncbi:cold-shock protein [Skermanella rosea]|uniref:cold-shock protein n=1 Tax=Skermanella rosea TaxID=1817965 RepID=UPI0019349DE9|nr:cold-shock protein [Skermanella rosea]